MRAITINDIPIGRQNAISREELCRITGKSDRRVREEISMLRKNGAVILSSATKGKGGYWIADTYEELTDFIRQMESYAKNCFMARDSALKLLKLKDQKNLGYL